MLLLMFHHLLQRRRNREYRNCKALLWPLFSCLVYYFMDLFRNEIMLLKVEIITFFFHLTIGQFSIGYGCKFNSCSGRMNYVWKLCCMSPGTPSKSKTFGFFLDFTVSPSPFYDAFLCTNKIIFL